MLGESQVKQFRRDGFLNAGKVLDDDTVDLLRSELDRVMDERDREDVPQPVLLRNLNSRVPDRPVWQIINIWEASRAFRKLAENREIVRCVSQLTGASQLRVWHDQIQYKPAETGGVTMWHQDSPLWPILQPKTSQVTAWVALDDTDESNGCMSMVVGSHSWGDQIAHLRSLEGYDRMCAEDPSGNKVRVRLCPVEKGCVHYHHGLTWHGSGANTSGRPRRAIAIHYMTEQTVYDSTGNHAMEQFVEVGAGSRLEGEHFPVVWAKASGSVVP
jgi:phytanoyl-CoA hydroxylase